MARPRFAVGDALKGCSVLRIYSISRSEHPTRSSPTEWFLTSGQEILAVQT